MIKLELHLQNVALDRRYTDLPIRIHKLHVRLARLLLSNCWAQAKPPIQENVEREHLHC